MNLTMNFFLIVFIILIIILTIFFPISGYYEVKKLKRSNANGDVKKIKFYRDTILWSWAPIFLIFLVIYFSGISIDNIGLKWINIDSTAFGKWVVIPIIGFYIFFLLYNIYLIFFFKNSSQNRTATEKELVHNFSWFLPQTQKEKKMWVLVSLSAGITEEILYRGYMFYALAIVFPSLSIIHILIISTLIFGVGHVYLGKEVIKSAILGFIFGLFYIVFDSVIPVIIIHIAQDLVMTNMLETAPEK